MKRSVNVFFAVTAMLVAMVCIIAAVFVVIFRIRRSAAIIARLAPAIVESPAFFALLERSTTRSHFLDRHGPLLNQLDVQERAKSGSIPFSKHDGRPVDSARWFKHEDLLCAVDSALAHWDAGSRPEGGVFDFAFDQPIGEGFLKGSDERVDATIARVIVKQGEVITAYPVLRAERH